MTAADACDGRPHRPSILFGHLVGGLALLALAVGPVAAHGAAATDFEAPLPLSYLLVGAGATVALTALGLGLTGTVPDGRRPLLGADGRWPARLATLARLGFLALVAAVIVQGLFGRQVATDNPATVLVWPLWLKGLALVAIVAGSPWRLLSPGRTLYRVLCGIEGRELQARTLPAWVGAWPAVAGFVCLVGLENLTAATREPATTAGLVAGYLALLLAGGVVFGPAWFRRADPIEVFFRLLGRISILSVGLAVPGPREKSGTRRPRSERDGESRTLADGGLASDASRTTHPLPPIGHLDRIEVALRPPWRGAARPVAGSGLVVLVVAAVYAVSFDGMVETPTYQAVLFGVRDLTGLGPAAAILLFLTGLVVFLVVFALLSTATGYLGRLANPSLALAPTLLPIAAAYEVAHTYPYVAANLGRLPALLGGSTVHPLSWLGVPAFWASQVGLIVAGHLVAVLAAHVVLSRRMDRSTTVVAHLPLVGLMIGYTVLSLWIVSRPVVG